MKQRKQTATKVDNTFLCVKCQQTAPLHRDLSSKFKARSIERRASATYVIIYCRFIMNATLRATIFFIVADFLEVAEQKERPTDRQAGNKP